MLQTAATTKICLIRQASSRCRECARQFSIAMLKLGAATMYREDRAEICGTN
jgi:hypothetical protein